MNENQSIPAARISKDVSCKVYDMTAGELYLKAKDRKIAVLNEWLQRLRQTKKWQTNKAFKARSFIYSFFNGNNLVTPFYFVQLDVFINHIENALLLVDDTVQQVYKELLKTCTEYQADGVELILLDGQNRLYEALIPFFEGTLPSDEYRKSFTVIFENGDESFVKNNFKYTDIDLDQRVKDAFLNTPVIVVEGKKGDISAFVDSVVDLNNGESWTKFECAIIQPTALAYKINKDIFHDPIIQTLFGSVDLSGNVSGMSGTYEIQKKGDARFIAELSYCIAHNCNSGVGGEDAICSVIKGSDSIYLFGYEKVKNYLSFISKTLDCPANKKVKEEHKPLSKESLRGLVLFLDLITNKQNHLAKDCNLRLPSLDSIKTPKIILEQFIRWHNEKIDKHINPQDFTDSKPNFGTYVRYTRDNNAEHITGRLSFINQWVTDNAPIWVSQSLVSEKSLDYKSKQTYLIKQQGYRDIYSKADPVIRLRDKIQVDHVKSQKNGGTNDIDNLVVTKAKPNQIKGARY